MLLQVVKNKLSQSKIMKLLKILDCIDSVETVGNTTYINYKENVIEVHPSHHITITNGVDVKIAKTIHLNPNIIINKTDNTDNIIKLVNKSIK